jgi:putative tricarboxylic transport membrane protein
LRAGRDAREVASGVVLLALCASAYWLTTRFPSVPAMLSQNIPPTFFPRLVLVAIAACAVFLIVHGAGATRQRDGGRDEARAPERPTPLVYATAAIVLVTPALIGLLGTWLVIALVCVVLPLLWRERRAVRIAALALGLPLAVYGLFTLALGVRFPVGPFG